MNPMDEELVDDLKLFITTTVAQGIQDVRDDLDKVDKKIGMVDKKLSNKIDAVDRKLGNKIDAVASTLTKVNDSTYEELDDHERRLKRLEHKTA